MAERTLSVGDHEYKIAAIALTDGGWTTAIIHIDRSKGSVAETRHESGLRYETEDEALSQGEVVAKHMAAKNFK